MTEKDNVTRVFLTTGGSPMAREVHPRYFVSELRGLEAVAVLGRADFRGVYHWTGTYPTKFESGHTTSEVFAFFVNPSNERFEISIMDWKHKHGPESYKKVAEALEKRSGKTGLTIVIS